MRKKVHEIKAIEIANYKLNSENDEIKRQTNCHSVHAYGRYCRYEFKACVSNESDGVNFQAG